MRCPSTKPQPRPRWAGLRGATDQVLANANAGLIPVAASTVVINSTEGGAVLLCSILAVIQPGTFPIRG
ncbi:MAG: hypothetical protein ABWK05_03080 [Pyrobaculum sp.]